MNDIPDTARLAPLLGQIWDTLGRGVSDGRAPARTLTLATSGIHGGGEARLVVLRGAERGAGQLFIHTDTLSGKIAELQNDPQGTLLMWDPGQFLQARLKGRFTIATGSDVAEHWRRIPAPAREAYGAMPPPGAPLRTPEALSINPRSSRFAVLCCTIESIDALVLDPDTHRRAQFMRDAEWAGQWIAP